MEEEYELAKDILDMVIEKGIRLQYDSDIKDSEYIVKICSNEKDSYFMYKKKNFLNRKEKDQKDAIERVKIKMKFK